MTWKTKSLRCENVRDKKDKKLKMTKDKDKALKDVQTCHKSFVTKGFPSKTMLVITYNQMRGNDNKVTQNGCDPSSCVLIGNHIWIR